MSAPEEHGEQQAEQRSRVKLTRNAKGEAQWEISIVEGADEEEIVRIRRIAEAQYDALTARLVHGFADEQARDEVPF